MNRLRTSLPIGLAGIVEELLIVNDLPEDINTLSSGLQFSYDAAFMKCVCPVPNGLFMNPQVGANLFHADRCHDYPPLEIPGVVGVVLVLLSVILIWLNFMIKVTRRKKSKD